MTNPLITANPLKFKLRIVWGFETKQKLVAEFCDSSWIPRVGEIMILPIEDADEFVSCQNWHKYKVENVAYDFQNQITCVICKSVFPVSSLPVKQFADIQRTTLQKLKQDAGIQNLARVDCKAQLEYEFTQINEEDINGELERLKRKLLD